MVKVTYKFLVSQYTPTSGMCGVMPLGECTWKIVTALEDRVG